jgi:cysteinyl-tRNA synthetase
MLETFNEVLGIIDFDVLKEEEIPSDILEKFEQRNKAKQEKNFELADKLRDELLQL